MQVSTPVYGGHGDVSMDLGDNLSCSVKLLTSFMASRGMWLVVNVSPCSKGTLRAEGQRREECTVR